MGNIAGSLRAELFGATTKTPAFALLLPAGWAKQNADGIALEARLREAARQVPDTDPVQFAASVEALIGQLRGKGDGGERLIATIAQTDPDRDDAEPMTLALAWLHSPTGTRIASLAGELVAKRGATPLDGAGAILRWIDRVSTPLDGGEIHTVQPTYLIRMPSTGDTALMIRTTILDGVGEHRLADEHMAALTALSDGIVSTFRWRRNV